MMIYIAKHRLDRLRIQPRTISRNPLDAQATGILMLPEPPEVMVVDNEQNTKGTVVGFIGSHTPRKTRKDFIQIITADYAFRLLFPRPPPISGWYPMEQRPDDRATNAMRGGFSVVPQ